MQGRTSISVWISYAHLVHLWKIFWINGMELRWDRSHSESSIVIPNIYLLLLILYFLTFKTHTPIFKFLEFFSSQISSFTIHRIHTMIEDIFLFSNLTHLFYLQLSFLGSNKKQGLAMGRTYFLSSFSFLCTFSAEVFEFQKWPRTCQLSL